MSHILEMIHFAHEVGMLAAIPRSGFAFLGSGKQSVAEHSFRVALVAYGLARLTNHSLDMYKLIMMCLLHDFPEARLGDLNYVQKRYIQPNLTKALEDIESHTFLGTEIVNWIEEYEQGSSLEAQIAHDADQLELLLCLKREQEMGNASATEWKSNLLTRLKTSMAKQVAESIWQTSSNEWWLKHS